MKSNKKNAITTIAIVVVFHSIGGNTESKEVKFKSEESAIEDTSAELLSTTGGAT